MNDSDLGVYISCYNEDLTILPVWKSVSKVFPQVKVLEVGSVDNSLSLLRNNGVKVIHEPVMSCDDTASKWYPDRANLRCGAYVALKSHYVSKHKWVFWIDGDELWPEEELRKIVPAINSGKYSLGYRIGWKFASKEKKQRILYDNYVLPADARIFRGDTLQWFRAYPKEYLAVREEKRPLLMQRDVQPCGQFSFWCWHLRYMTRSTVEPDRIRVSRTAAQIELLDLFDKVPVDRFPWE